MARIRSALLPLAFLIAGGSIAALLVTTRPEAKQQAPEDPVTFVRTERAVVGHHRVTIAVMGVVRAEREVTLQPEVSGVVIEQSEHLADGELLEAGELLVRLDARDYASAVKISRADLAQAELGVREENVQRRVAAAEWKDTPEDFSEDSRAYVMREPHLDAAQARVDSARTRIRKAKRDLSKTSIHAPFDAVVLTENVELGQLVGPQAPIARLAGIDRYWIQASIPVSQLPFVEIPRVNTQQRQGSAATVIDRAAGGQPRAGYVLRLLPAVEERGRMAQIVLAVDDPLGLRVPLGQRPTPLLVGTYVEAQIAGRTLEQVVPVPRPAMIDDGHLWIVDDEGRLRMREVEVTWRERGRVFVGAGLTAEERIVVSNLPLATEGMRVEVTDEHPKPAPAPADPPG
ncbi:MAG: efflux RND transporter periplasmic adaptor subunit [Myxococcota bacterium]